MINPYIAGHAVTGPNFYGRADLLAELRHAPFSSIYLIGNRRMGKTSILKQLEANPEGAWPVVIDLQAIAGKPAQFPRYLAKQTRRLARTIPALADAEDTIGKYASPSEALERLTDRAENAGATLLLLWDECELLFQWPEDELLKLRAALLNREIVRTILTATKRLTQINTLFKWSNTSPFLYGFSPTYLTRLAPAAAAGLIRQSQSAAPVRASDQIVERIEQASGYHPFLVQTLCRRMFDRQGGTGELPDDLAETDLVIDDLLAAILQEDYTGLTTTQRKILRASTLQGGVTLEALKDAIGKEAETLAASVREMDQLGFVIADANGAVRIGNEFLRNWLRTRVATELPPSVSDKATIETEKAAGAKIVLGTSAARDTEHMQDFTLVVSPAAPGAPYPLNLAASPAGTASSQMTLDAAALEPLVGRWRQLNVPPDKDAIRRIGRMLFDALMAGPIRERFAAAYAGAISSGSTLRVRLRFDAPELIEWPWELMHDSGQDGFLSLLPNLAVVRETVSPNPPRLAALPRPLRVLLLRASPRTLAPLGQGELKKVREALAPLEAKGLVAVEAIDGATDEALQAEARKGFHVLHVIAHASAEGAITFQDAEGEADPVEAEAFRYLIAGTAVRLVFLNACETADASDPKHANLAALLVRAGLPAVVAMQAPLSDRAGAVFARQFYSALADGFAVEAGLAEGRKAVMREAGLGRPEWGIPVLYLQPGAEQVLRFD